MSTVGAGSPGTRVGLGDLGVGVRGLGALVLLEGSWQVGLGAQMRGLFEAEGDLGSLRSLDIGVLSSSFWQRSRGVGGESRGLWEPHLGSL